MTETRRKTKIDETLETCHACQQFPLSHRHHLLPFSQYGEHTHLVESICANCHWLMHIAIGTYLNHSAKHSLMWNHVLNTFSHNDIRIKWVLQKVHETRELQFDRLEYEIDYD